MSDTTQTEVTEATETTEATNVTEDMIPEFEIEIGDTSITKERVLATIRAGLMLLTTIANMAGLAFDVNSVYQIILCVLMVASVIWGYWKNNNWTVNAVIAQNVKNNLTGTTEE